MRLVSSIFGLGVLIGGAAYAASPEAAYWAARDRALATMKKLETTNASDAKEQATEKAALADLTKRLAAIVGAVSVKGFAASPKINLDTLGDGPGNGMLDGLAFDAGSEKQEGSRLVVTTRPLIEKWLQARSADKDASNRVPAKLEEALRDDNFYSFAVGADAAFSRAFDLELPKPAGADFAVGAIGRWSQDEGPSPLDRLVVAIVKGNRTLIADVGPETKVPEIPACKAAWDSAKSKAAKLDKAYQDGGAKDEKLTEESAKVQQQGSQDWLACVGKSAKSAPFYPLLQKEAQDLAARMAGG